MTRTVLVWQCVGCGRIDHPAPCVGICEDRKVEMVYAGDHAQALSRIDVLEEIVRRIATVTPTAGQWEGSYRALQEGARRALAET